MKNRHAALALAIVIAAADAHAQWSPPIGVPAPPFGVNEVCGETTVTVAPGAPIPNPIPAGAVVQLSGNYTGERQIVFAGSALRPACLRGPVTSTGEWQISGTNGILEKVKLQGESLVVLGFSDRIAVRDFEVTGVNQQSNSAVAVTTWSAQNTSNIVLLRGNVHDNVPPVAGGDPDNHGVFIGPNRGVAGDVYNVWVLDSTFTNNSGDGVQVNGEENGTNGGLHHIYIGRNLATTNWQGGFWAKNSAHVVMASNVAFNNKGHGFGYQYDPQSLWIIFNEAHGNAAGIRTGSRNNNTRRNVYMIGNVLRDNSQVGLEVNDHVDGDFLIAHNTVAANPAGIRNGYGPAKPTIVGNIAAGGIDFNQGGSYGPPVLVANLTTPPPFVGLTDFHLVASSTTAIDKGVTVGATDYFKLLYGVDIAVDRDGTPRPQGLAVDIGAYEFTGVAASPSPTPFPSPSPSATPTPQPSPSPSPTPHPSPSPSATPTPLPSPSPTPPPAPQPAGILSCTSSGVTILRLTRPPCTTSGHSQCPTALTDFAGFDTSWGFGKSCRVSK